jgi:two-component system, LytTR family, response regulator
MREKPIRSVIIEDEKEALLFMSALIEATGMAEVCGSTSNPDDAVDLIISCDPEIVFLDIMMPGKSGFDVLNELKRLPGKKPYIVFTTASNEHAIKAFEYAAFDYLVKPVDLKRLRETLLRFQKTSSNDFERKANTLSENDSVLIFKSINGAVFIDPSEIVSVTADGNYSTFLFISGRTETVTTLLGNIENQIAGNHFFRTSRSCVINTSFLTKIDSKQCQCILTKNGREFKCEIARDKIKALLEFMKNKTS